MTCPCVTSQEQPLPQEKVVTDEGEKTISGLLCFRSKDPEIALEKIRNPVDPIFITPLLSCLDISQREAGMRGLHCERS